MHLQRLPTVEDVTSTIDAGRRRLADVDVADASRSAISSVREALPEGWPGHRRQSRWPLVAAIMLGATVIGLAFMTPMLRRWSVSARAAAPIQDATGEQQSSAASDVTAADRPDGELFD